MQLRVKYLNPKLPELVSSNENSGADVRACVEHPITIEHGKVASIPLGIAAELVDYPDSVRLGAENDASYELQIRPRSGHTARGVITQLGTVDAGYRGEIYANVFNTSGQPVTVEPFERIGQLVVCSIYKPEIVTTRELSKTERGGKGFGSSGRF